MKSEILGFDTNIVVALFYLTLILAAYWKKNWSFRNAVPVCLGAPIFGFLYNFHPIINYQKKLANLRRKYGKLCYVDMGSHRCLCLNDYKLIKEAWSTLEFCGRPQLPGIVSRTHGFVGGIIFNDGKDFTEQRRFTVKHLKEHGLGKVSMEQIIMHEVNRIANQIGAANGEPISTRHLFNLASLNILWTITTGESHNQNDGRLLTLLDILTRNMELQGGSMLAFFIPWIAKMFPVFSGWNAYLQDARQIFDYWREYADQRIKNYNSNQSRVPNFVDIYIQQIQNCNDPESSFYRSKGELSLAATLQDLFIAGSETSSITLSWIFLYAAAFQQFQLEVYNEIKSTIGTEECPTLAHRKRMPVTEAFIYETMRHLTLAPLGMVHCTLAATNLHGFHIPKGTLVFANLHAAHHDSKVWQEPEIFNPHRFLSNDGKSVLRNDAFSAFSSGKRGCPGEALAKNELFLFLVGILQKYLVVSKQAVDLSPLMGVSATPRSNNLIFKKRQ